MQASSDPSPFMAGAGRSARAGRVSRALGCALVLLLVLVVFRTFVADVYRINSGSMRPTLMGGAAPRGGQAFTEWVLGRRLLVYEKGH